MAHSQNITTRDGSSDVAPTPQNTPLDNAVLASRPANLGKPQVEDIGEGEEDDEGGGEDVSGVNPASLLAKVSAKAEVQAIWMLQPEAQCAETCAENLSSCYPMRRIMLCMTADMPAPESRSARPCAGQTRPAHRTVFGIY